MHFNCNINPQGWLPPCYLSVVVAGSAIHGHTLRPPIESKSTCLLTTRPGGVRSEQAPGKSEGEGAVAEPDVIG